MVNNDILFKQHVQLAHNFCFHNIMRTNGVGQK